MVQFGPNGTVTGSASASSSAPSSYSVPTKGKLKRVALACFLCGVAACISVAIIAVVVFFTYSTIVSVTGLSGNAFSVGQGFLGGASIALGMSAMNWYFFYITIPAAWLALGLSIGRLPRRGITNAAPYYRWGVIWGAILVGATTTFFSITLGGGFDPSFNRATPSFIAGASLTGLAVGAVAGALCGGLFLAIVRPAEQVRRIQVDVF